MDIVNTTKNLVSISSVFPKEEELALFIKKWLEKNTDCKVEVQSVVTIGPAGGNAHKANEYVDIKSLEKTYYSYLKILKKFDSLYD